MKGEEKSRKQNRCYYGADGKVQKVAMGGEPKPEPSAGGSANRKKKKSNTIKNTIIKNKIKNIQKYNKKNTL